MQKHAAIIKICEKLGCEYSIVSGANFTEEMRNKEDWMEQKHYLRKNEYINGKNNDSFLI